MFNFQKFITTFFRPVLLTSIEGTGTNVPPMTGAQGLACKSISEHFVAIGNILAEGKIGEEYSRHVANKLYEAKLASDVAVSHGWNGGGSNY